RGSWLHTTPSSRSRCSSLHAVLRFYLVPFTSQVEKFRDLSEALYSMYASGSGGLTRDSIALIDQVRYVDQARITGRLGRFTETEYEPVRRAIKVMFAF
ncbi:type II toxin-antitoxin system PemK/MazF family toxin, partial [Deinococcus soli (ex Cha et al. 2016)]